MLATLALLSALAAGPTAEAPPKAKTVDNVEVNADPSLKRGGPRAATVVFRGLKDEELICKKEIPVGSRMPVRTCRSAYDWAEKDAASLRDLDQMIGKGTFP